MFKVSVCLVAAILVNTCSGGYFPPYITACSAVDPNIEQCVRKQIEITLPHFTMGIPELDVPSLDPVYLTDIIVDGSGLKLKFTNPMMFGVSKMKLTDLKIDVSQEKFTLAVKGNLFLKTDYKIDGQILILPIKGEGNSTIKATGTDVVITSRFERVRDERGEHFKLVQPTYTYKMERTSFRFENLFGGNKVLSDATHRFVNENWQQIMDEVAPPIIKQIVKTCVKSINKFFLNTLTEQIFRDQDQLPGH